MKNNTLKELIKKLPKEWIVLNNMDPEDATSIGVLEVRNGSDYNIPHFVYYSVGDNKLDSKQQSKIIDCCIKASKSFENLFGENAEEILEDHRLGFFGMTFIKDFLEEGLNDNEEH